MRVNNFEIHHKAIETLSIVDIVRIYDYLQEMRECVPASHEILDEFEEILEPFGFVIEQCETDETCPRCGCLLYMSDSPKYAFVCATCNKNFN